MKTKLHKKYYVPGIVSAILIPLVFWYYGNAKLKEPAPNVMDIGLPAKYNPNFPVNQQNNLESFRNWNFQKIIVQPNTAKENSKFYVAEIKKLQASNEKDTGIDFTLTDQNFYGDFASILNDLAIAKHEIYGLDLEKTGHIFALVDYNDPNIIKEPCYLCNDNIAIFEKPNLIFDFQNYISHLPKQSYYIIFGYLILLNISMLNIKKFI